MTKNQYSVSRRLSNLLLNKQGCMMLVLLMVCPLHEVLAEPIPMIEVKTGNCFQNGAQTERVAWRDTDGNLINAHDGGMIFADGAYHWYGLALRPGPVASGVAGGQKTTIGVVMYRSTDLYNWKYEGVILECSADPESPLRSPMRFERPKIVYNEKTKRFVMWVHFVGYPGDHGQKPGLGEAGVASCATVNGKYTFHGTTRPLDDDGYVRDSTLYKDDDGSAYFIYDRDIRDPGSNFGRVLQVVKLSDDYLTWTETYYKIENAERREAPTVVKRNGYYYLITSGLTSWAFNPAKYFRAKSLLGPYEDMGDPCPDAGNETTYESQSTYAFEVEGKDDQFIVMLERHYTKSIMESSYVWLPALFTRDGLLELPYLTSWRWENWPQTKESQK